LDGIRITPDAENPICRIPLRTDIYQLAAQANILNVPGSAVEDRQYQISVKGVCAYTTTWKNYQLSINKVCQHIVSLSQNILILNIYCLEFTEISCKRALFSENVPIISVYNERESCIGME